jgi:hypothetical protein
MILLVLPALALRPDQGGLYAFDSSDQLEYLDGPEGLVRVTYSVDGPNVTLLDDEDLDGLPDFPQSVALHAEAVLELYQALGFRSPVTEAELGEELGGSLAFDFYLVDFNFTGDGLFSTDGCIGQRCGGFMVMENDFEGYGYPSLETAIKTLTSHELFHAVQAAYRANQEIWISEGTATWGEHQYDAENTDFFSLCNAYLGDPGRSLDQPPSGPVPAFAYGTALFWQFLTERHGPEPVLALMEAEDSADGLEAVDMMLGVLGSSWEEEWPVFVTWNLGTGSNYGGMESYPFANHVKSVTEEAEGAVLMDDNRFYPLAATYYTLEHPGGPLFFSTSDDPAGLFFALHPVGESGVEAAVVSWYGEGPGVKELGEFSMGSYKFFGSYPMEAEESNKVEFCLGGTAELCMGEAGDSGDSGVKESGKEEPEGCGCRAGGGGVAVWGLIGAAMTQRRRGRRDLMK